MLYLVLLVILGGCVVIIYQLIQSFGFKNVEYTLHFSADEVTEGDTVILTETICSRKILPIPWLKAELTTHSALEFAQHQSTISKETRFLSSYYFLRPYRQIERQWQVKCTKRGVFSVYNAILVISDLLGTQENSKKFPDAHAELTVLPKPAVADALPSPAVLCMTGDSILRTHFLPDRFAVDGIKPYEYGDNLRDVCQTASARSESLMVYRYTDTADPTMTVLLGLATKDYDFERVSDTEAYEQAIRIACKYLCDATAARIPVRFCANTTLDGIAVSSLFGTGDAHTLLLRRLLSQLPDTITERVENTLYRVLSSDHTSSVVLVTAHLTEQMLRIAADCPRLHIVCVRHLPVNITLNNVYSAADAESKGSTAS